VHREDSGYIGRLLEALAMAKEAIQRYEEDRHKETRMMIAMDRKAMQANRLGDRMAADKALTGGERWQKR